MVFRLDRDKEKKLASNRTIVRKKRVKLWSILERFERSRVKTRLCYENQKLKTTVS